MKVKKGTKVRYNGKVSARHDLKPGEVYAATGADVYLRVINDKRNDMMYDISFFEYKGRKIAKGKIPKKGQSVKSIPDEKGNLSSALTSGKEYKVVGVWIDIRVKGPKGTQYVNHKLVDVL
jgi:hypothetical protein|tara:strand:+ start:15343 stop:15705 length:363 start_codon:yes stop_codon:yes gene_type:complete